MILGIIPARFASSRFPGKPLIDLKGKPMIQRVWEQACMAKSLDHVIVATDDARIATVVRAFGGDVVMTPANCPTGTDRIAVAARKWRGPKPSIVVNVQGDEPLLPPAMIDLLVKTLKAGKAPMATLARPFDDEKQFRDPNCVKVVCDRTGKALYFSRAALPYLRDKAGRGLPKAPLTGLHVGLYAYRGPFLQQVARLKPTPLEQAEKLEQLRVLEHGFDIAVAFTKLCSQAIDTPADAIKVRRLVR